MVPVFVATIPLSKSYGIELGDDISVSWPDGLGGFVVTKITRSIDGTATIEGTKKVCQPEASKP
jgi:hypothetical protein